MSQCDQSYDLMQVLLCGPVETVFYSCFFESFTEASRHSHTQPAPIISPRNQPRTFFVFARSALYMIQQRSRPCLPERKCWSQSDIRHSNVKRVQDVPIPRQRCQN